MNVWSDLTNEAEVRRAEELIAAAIGADEDPAVLLGEIQRACDRFLSGDPDAIAEKLLAFVTALVGVSRGAMANTAALVADVKGENADDHRVTRPYELHFLDQAVQAFLATLSPPL